MRIGKIECLLLLAITLIALAAGRKACAEVLLLPQDHATKSMQILPIHPQPEPDPISVPDHWRPPRPSDLPFRVTSSRVDVRIEENVARTTLEQTFLNLTPGNLEVRVLIPLPRGAAINRSALSMNDEMVEGTLHGEAEALQIYESIVRQRRDPALLRFSGEGLYEARIFPVPPGQERRLQFSYDQVLAPVNGLYEFRHILAGSQLYRSGVERFQFECQIRSQSPMGPVYSPSHKVNVERPDPRTAVIKLREENLSSDRDFQLYYSPSTEEVALRMVAGGGPEGEDGYFMLLARPDDQLEHARILPKEIVFVMDTSGSMATNGKIEQAKKALAFCLNQLREQDRFNLITFSTDVKALSDGKLIPATRANLEKALAAVDSIEATGGTAIDDALRAALANDFTEGPSRAKMVAFFTDGLPSVGLTDLPSILKDASEANTRLKARIFSFGVGTDVNTHLLDRLALDHDGSSSYVAPKEDLELKVSDFFNRIKNPVMTDVTFDFGTARVGSVYPRKIPALFKGSEVTVLGRFKGAGPGFVTLKGFVAGEAREIRIPVEWPTRVGENAFLPRIWAMRKVGHLLEEIRLRGSNPETIEEIVALSQRHGIVTPYTSQLVLEPGQQPPPAVWRGDAGRLRAEIEERAMAPASPATASPALEGAGKRAQFAARNAQDAAAFAKSEQKGSVAVGLTEFEKVLKDASLATADAPQSAPAPSSEISGRDRDAEEARKLRNQAFLADKKSIATSGKAGEDLAENEAAYRAAAQEVLIKQAGARTFYLRAGIWVDSTYKDEKQTPPTVLKAFSKEYFELLQKHPDLGPALALGQKILVLVEGKAYRVEE